MMNSGNEKRSSYVQLKDLIKGSALAHTVFGRTEPLTCRVMVNIGLELVISGVELLKLHGITKEQVIEFLERLYATPGAIEGMEKGGANESLLRLAMRMINGEIIRHTEHGDVREAASSHPAEEVIPDRNSRIDWN